MKAVLAGVVLVLASLSAHALTNTVFNDIDGDGDLDVYLTVLLENNLPTSFILLNASDGIGNVANVTQGYWVDMDGDSEEDLYIVRTGVDNVLFTNDGDKTFTNVTNATLGQRLRGNDTTPTGTAFADFDNDGDVDALIGDTFWASNGSFANVNATNLSNLQRLPRLDHVVANDTNLDGLRDVLGVAENGSAVLFLNVGDTNGDGVPEFYDASVDVQFDLYDAVNFAAVGDIDVGLLLNESLGYFPFSGKTTPFILEDFLDVYFARNGSNVLLIQRFAETRERFIEADAAMFAIPRFVDKSAESGTDDASNSTVAIVEDLTGENVTEIFVGNLNRSHKAFVRNGSSWLVRFLEANLTGFGNISEFEVAQVADLDGDGDLDFANMVVFVNGSNVSFFPAQSSQTQSTVGLDDDGNVGTDPSTTRPPGGGPGSVGVAVVSAQDGRVMNDPNSLYAPFAQVRHVDGLSTNANGLPANTGENAYDGEGITISKDSPSFEDEEEAPPSVPPGGGGGGGPPPSVPPPQPPQITYPVPVPLPEPKECPEYVCEDRKVQHPLLSAVYGKRWVACEEIDQDAVDLYALASGDEESRKLYRLVKQCCPCEECVYTSCAATPEGKRGVRDDFLSAVYGGKDGVVACEDLDLTALDALALSGDAEDRERYAAVKNCCGVLACPVPGAPVEKMTVDEFSEALDKFGNAAKAYGRALFGLE